ncbi:monosaccharide-transporting ATPase [Brachyspira pilosicoli WesB]|uniref:Monosaccharide-transporting ATPase n=1 Tax=Brachyspira pilosicoli WesB TaxID=1161918 RepID=K0JMC2_BRAPL|nr:ABC transporter permease [Brachyspira pilosicoli]CCG57650.1 monosaccharide-transporting ATPase [Brachyspira pilosicoli WesB]
MNNIDKTKKRLSNIGTIGTLILIIIVMSIVLLILRPNSFGTYTNFNNLLRQTSINGIIALGMTIVIITAGIDLSVGAIVAYSGVLVSQLTVLHEMPVLLAVLISILLSTIIGIFNGILVHDAKIPPFIATMGTMTILRGFVKFITGGRMINNVPDSLTNICQMNILGIPFLFLIWFILIIFTYIFLNHTVAGRNIYALGSSREVARLSGINIRTHIYLAYTISGLFSGIAGILLVSRLGAGVPTAGLSYELDAIASSVIGGASLTGAEGSAIGTILGAFIMQMLRNGGNLLGIDPFILEMVIGFLIVISVYVDQLRKLKKS